MPRPTHQLILRAMTLNKPCINLYPGKLTAFLPSQARPLALPGPLVLLLRPLPRPLPVRLAQLARPSASPFQEVAASHCPATRRACASNSARWRSWGRGHTRPKSRVSAGVSGPTSLYAVQLQVLLVNLRLDLDIAADHVGVVLEIAGVLKHVLLDLLVGGLDLGVL